MAGTARRPVERPAERGAAEPGAPGGGVVAVGVDGSPQSLTAAEWAADEALRSGRALRIVQVWDPPAAATVRPDAVASHRRWAEQRLDAARRTAGERAPGVEIAVERVEGAAVRTLSEQEAEVLVLGSRGLAGMSGRLVGSVGLAVVTHAARPVVLVRDGGDGPVGRPGDEGPVVLGIDVRHHGDPLLAFAFRAAADRGALLDVVYAWNPKRVYGYAAAPLDGDLTEEYQEQEEADLARVLAPWREAYPGVAVAERVVHGSAAHELITASGDAALLVTGHRRPRPAHPARLGHVTHGVVHHAPCPVAVVPHDGQAGEAGDAGGAGEASGAPSADGGTARAAA
ncbi:universal stress protein [Streptomyces zingiberis]|uniref:Universal stress protein n=1 Tax=Streptomyces zingiberis TaxID=2053010 RepID=A0ABX1BSU4_9ACTN|nr:universal stress protein [Streptomyces zingiberis]NJQ00158.1 universal stress protein [Streptomyces zingiberis]